MERIKNRSARRSVRVVAIAASLGLVLAACGGSDEPAAPAPAPAPAPGAEAPADAECGLEFDGECIADAETWAAAQEEGGLTLYTALSELREIAVVEVFEADTGLDVDIVRLGGGALVERILSEFGAGVLGADVIRQTDYALATQEFEAGVFDPFCPLNIELVSDDLRWGEDGCAFYASMQPTYAIAYNTALVSADEAPKTWTDLTDPKWEGRLCLAHIGAGGSTWARDLWLRDTYGTEHWEALAAQNPVITGAAGQVTEVLTRGECAVAHNLPGTVSLAIEQGAPLQIVFPEDGVVAYSQWTGLAQGAERPNAARVFLNWQMSLKGQTAVAERAGDFPTVAGAPAPTVNAGAHGETLAPPPGDPRLVFPEALPEYVTSRDEYLADWFRIFGYSPN